MSQVIKFTEEQITAFVLGELTPTERQAFEAAMAKDPALQAEVQSLAMFTGKLHRAMQAEKTPSLSPAQRASLMNAAVPKAKPWFSGWRLAIAPLAAASLALVFYGRNHGWDFKREQVPASSPADNEDVMTAITDDESRSEYVEHPKAKKETTYADVRAKADKAPSKAAAPAPSAARSGPSSINLSRLQVGVGAMPSATSGNIRLSQTETKLARRAAPAEMELADGVTSDLDEGGLDHNTEAYDRIAPNEFLAPGQHPLSTFSIDVDTAYYANVRRFINSGTMPPPDSVRIEELINYFPYDYKAPTNKDPFAVNVEIASSPWTKEHRLVRIGIKGKDIKWSNRPASNLVFLIDVSGSMNDANKLPLLVDSLKLVVDSLGEKDRIALAVYAGSSGLVLPSTSGDEKAKIIEALERLQAGGSTNGGAGIQLAYDTAQKNFIKGGINRVIIATDGDFNVGSTSQGDLIRMIEEKAKGGVFLSVLGYGMGNYKDSTLEKLADKGNGNYAYIDTLNEAKKVLVEQAGGTMMTIAKDVKIQVEFNPGEVSAYRLIGYENRMLAAQDFNDDTKDAGEIGAGHTVTAIYEVVPKGVKLKVPGIDPLRYQTPVATNGAATTGEMFTLKLRYKEPDGKKSKLMKSVVKDGGKSFDQASNDFRFAAAVAAYGMTLQDSKYKGSATIQSAVDMAKNGKGNDEGGYRTEFIELMLKSKKLSR